MGDECKRKRVIIHTIKIRNDLKIIMKNVIIFGDSYSTYEGYIPEGYHAYYSKNGREGEPAVTKMRVEETWWYQVISKTKDNLLLNNSWSGSTIGYTGYNNSDCSKSSSFIYRFRKLKEEGFFEKNKVDTVFVFGGTNDSWAGAPLGEMKFSEWEEKNLYFVQPAICYLMNTLKTELPNAKIYFIVNTDLNPVIEDCLKKAGEYYNVPTISLIEIEKECGHPNVKGMKLIAEQVLQRL